MRTFKHLAQLSDDELWRCLNHVAEMLQDIETALQDRAPHEVQSDDSKSLQAEQRHQQRVYNQLREHAAMRRFS